MLGFLPQPNLCTLAVVISGPAAQSVDAQTPVDFLGDASMSTRTHRRLAAFTLAAGCLALSALLGPAVAADTTVRRLDPAAAATKPSVDALTPDLGALLGAAQYGRSGADPEAPKNALTSVHRLVNALQMHQGLAYVALAERVAGGDQVAVKALYVLEGAAGASQVENGAPIVQTAGKGAVSIDLDSARLRPLAETLQGHLGDLLPPVETARPASLAEVISALEGNTGAAYVVLAKRAGPAAVADSRVFVVPDVLRISIADEAGATAGGDAPEVELVPDPAGGPPTIKFEFDPNKYIKE
jgi:hypothetical protein